MRQERTTCDKCGAVIGMETTGAVSCAIEIRNYHVMNGESPPKPPSLEAQLDFCDRACAKAWMERNL